jgi:hypothetical protein
MPITPLRRAIGAALVTLLSAAPADAQPFVAAPPDSAATAAAVTAPWAFRTARPAGAVPLGGAAEGPGAAAPVPGGERGRRIRRGAAIGAAVGLAALVLLSAAVSEEGSAPLVEDPAFFSAATRLVGGGAVIGALVGALAR